MWVEDWTSAAACRQAQPDQLFVRGAEQNKAKQLCTGCPVRTECLAEALDNQIEWGVWGGTTEKKRGDLLGNRRGRAPFRGCGTPYAYRTHRENGEDPCAACLRAWTDYCQERKRIRLGRTA